MSSAPTRRALVAFPGALTRLGRSRGAAPHAGRADKVNVHDVHRWRTSRRTSNRFKRLGELRCSNVHPGGGLPDARARAHLPPLSLTDTFGTLRIKSKAQGLSCSDPCSFECSRALVEGRTSCSMASREGAPNKLRPGKGTGIDRSALGAREGGDLHPYAGGARREDRAERAGAGPIGGPWALDRALVGAREGNGGNPPFFLGARAKVGCAVLDASSKSERIQVHGGKADQIIGLNRDRAPGLAGGREATISSAGRPAPPKPRARRRAMLALDAGGISSPETPDWKNRREGKDGRTGSGRGLSRRSVPRAQRARGSAEAVGVGDGRLSGSTRLVSEPRTLAREAA